MNWRERLLTVFSGERPYVMPWFADLNYWRPAQDMEEKLADKWKGDEGLVRLHKDLNVGMFLSAPSVVECYYDDGVEVIEKTEQRRRGKETSSSTTKTIFSTPIGDIEEAWQYRKLTHSSAPTEYAVKTVADLKVLAYIGEHQDCESHYDDYLYYCKLWGDQGLPVCIIPRTPLADMFLRWAGILNATYLEADSPNEFAQAIYAMGRGQDKLYQIVAESPAELVEIGENLSSEVFGQRLFRKYAFDYYCQRINQLHEAGKKVGIHIDGTLSLLPIVAETGLDFVESVTPAPVGDAEIEELRALSANMVIWGGLPGAMFAPPFTKDDLAEHVRRILNKYEHEGKFIIGTADQIPPNGNIGYVPYISELLEKH